MTAPDRPSRVDESISPETADALLLVMAHDDVSKAEALRRLVGYGALVFRTARLERADVVFRRGEVERIVLLDEGGDTTVRELARDVEPLVWMRPMWSTVACAFPQALITAGVDPLVPLANCDRWTARDLVQDDEADRCPACQRAANLRPQRTHG